jgi:hypothetical protein
MSRKPAAFDRWHVGDSYPVARSIRYASVWTLRIAPNAKFQFAAITRRLTRVTRVQ